ncbi:MAG: hypothetical protein LIP01_07035 [Tannerellaceae bacterium]|nr:hypothetical protein [Tannerellaceae bacterium]
MTGLCLYPDSKGSVWVGTVKDGLYRYNRVLDTFRKEDLVKEFGIREFESIGSIMEDKYDRLWIGYGNGIAVYDHNNRHLQPYRFENSYNITLNTSVVNVFRTSDQHMVIGTVFTGLFYIKELETGVNFYHLSDTQSKTGGVTVNDITTDAKGEVWVATNCMGVLCLDNQGKIKKQYGQERLGVADILSLSFDQEGNLWAGALSNGLYKIQPAGGISHYINQPDRENTLSGRTVFGTYPLAKDSIFIASNKGIDLYNDQTGSFVNLLPVREQDYAFCRIIPDGMDIWFINYNSMYRFNRQTRMIHAYAFEEPRNLFIESAYLTEDKQIIAGTTRGELYRLEGDELVVWKIPERSRSIAGIEEDMDGNLWLTSGNRLIRINPDGEMRSVNLVWSLGENDFTTRSFCKDNRGMIYFGTSDGLLTFDPRILPLPVKNNPVLYLSEFKLFNEPVLPAAIGLLKNHINYTDKIILNHNQNFISFGVTLVDYEADLPVAYRCRYRLEKFDDKWYEINPASNEISFTGLTTGQYTLQIRLEGEDNILLASKDIHIVVKPHPLLTWYMQLVYALILLGIIWLIIQFVNRQRRSRELIRQAHQEQEELTRMNAMKLEFLRISPMNSKHFWLSFLLYRMKYCLIVMNRIVKLKFLNGM